ncbi:hypothetical protein [Photobacterium leiognathi]|uniref:hypothetical protein n=1 Tax=Photobacterium leiognathi TaxID=553611 RepID=UPI0027384073|nr:hypothetical protein [Photobacterium leiognathi]
MSYMSAIKKTNRYNNAGGIFPSALNTTHALIAIISLIQKKAPSPKKINKLILMFFYLWLTNNLKKINAISDIPDLVKVSGSENASPHALRIFRSDGISWAEYSLNYQHDDETYLWQTVPNYINHFFTLQLQEKMSYGTPLLNNKEKDLLLTILKTSWEMPAQIKHRTKSRKPQFYCYFSSFIALDPQVPVIAKYIFLGKDALHHNSARYYQKTNSDYIRHSIFETQTRALKRLSKVLNDHAYTLYFDVHGEKQSLFQQLNYDFVSKEEDDNNKPPLIKSYIKEKHGSRWEKKEIAPLTIGSLRPLDISDIREFFKSIGTAIDNKAKQPNMTTKQLRELYTLLTYQIACEFLILTGCRPTHSISIELKRCFNLSNVLISDKGKFRTLFICEYLKQRITHYQSIQHVLLNKLGITSTPSTLWFLIDENNEAKPLNAKLTNQFIQKYWPENAVTPANEIDAYRFRHTVAQTALNHQDPPLTSQQIDKLMGHSKLGEHYGNDQLLPTHKQTLLSFLNNLPELFKLNNYK